MCKDPFMLSNEAATNKLVCFKEAKLLCRNMTMKYNLLNNKFITLF